MSDAVLSPFEMLAKPWPDFYVVLETDPTRGMKMFMDAGYRYLMARPPKEFTTCPGVEPADFAIQVITALIKDDCRKLKLYRDLGRPFLAWFRMVAVRKAIEIIRKEGSVTSPLVTVGPGDDDIFDHVARVQMVVTDADLVIMIRESIQSFGDHPCHRILWMRFIDGYSNQEISKKSSESWSNVEVGNRFRRCRLRLIDKLKERGITPDDIL